LHIPASHPVHGREQGEAAKDGEGMPLAGFLRPTAKSYTTGTSLALKSLLPEYAYVSSRQSRILTGKIGGIVERIYL